MKLNGTFIYQGSEKRNGIKDPSKVYFEVALLSGVEQLRWSNKFSLAVGIPLIKRLIRRLTIISFIDRQ